ncbi:MAG: hypothetical protein FWD86_03890, partial [Firmicutes bacterium]|nr:hypothetical protein [Bacillota bacterium]
YENVVFKNLIDKILLYLKRTLYSLLANQFAFDMQAHTQSGFSFDHVEYYQAIASLYSCFFKHHAPQDTSRLERKIKQILKLISKYLNHYVYTKNYAAKQVVGQLKQTNIFNMHTDYKQVYSLFNYLQKAGGQNGEKNGDEQDGKSEALAYLNFCSSLVTFAATHFNLKPDKNALCFKDKKLNATLNFKNFECILDLIKVEVLDLDAIQMKFYCQGDDKNKKNYLLVPLVADLKNNSDAYYQFVAASIKKSGQNFDKIIFFDTENGNKNNLYSFNKKTECRANYGVLPINISDLNSFRRVQKLMLECMIGCDTTHQFCAFCGDNLKVGNEGSSKECKKCGLKIKKINCTLCQKDFFASIDLSLKRTGQSDDLSAEQPHFFNQEKLFNFKNITEIVDGAFVCPHCNQKHSY